MESHNFRSISDERVTVPRRSRVRVASESAAGLKSTAARAGARTRLLSESGAVAKKSLHTHAAATFSFLGSSSSQHKAKEEAKCALRTSERKQRDIDDPEEVLLRYVLVNNAMKNLRIKMRREKAVKRNKAISRAAML